MNKVMKMASSLISMLFGLAMTLGPVQADYNVIDGNSLKRTIKAFECGTDVNGNAIICPGYTPQDVTGGAFGISSNPFYVTFAPGTVLPAFASTPSVKLQDGSGTPLSSTDGALDVNCPSCGGGGGGGGGVSPFGTNPTSTLTLPASTSAYGAGDLIANSATAGSVVVPSFSIANSAGAAIIPRIRLATNDATATAWGNQTVQVDLWSSAPTFANGDRGAWVPATGTAAHLGSYTCALSVEYGDGAYSECSPNVGTSTLLKLASGTAIYWTLESLTGSGVTGAGKTFTLTAEVLN